MTSKLVRFNGLDFRVPANSVFNEKQHPRVWLDVSDRTDEYVVELCVEMPECVKGGSSGSVEICKEADFTRRVIHLPRQAYRHGALVKRLVWSCAFQIETLPKIDVIKYYNHQLTLHWSLKLKLSDLLTNLKQDFAKQLDDSLPRTLVPDLQKLVMTFVFGDSC